MKHTARQVEVPVPNLEYGEVTAVTDGKNIQVLTTFGTITAQTSVSCLVSPVPGDRILLCADISGKSYILSVMERSAGINEIELALQGNVKLSAENGSLSLSAAQNVSISSADSIDIATGQVNMNADRGEVVINKFTFMGSAVYTQAKRFIAVAKTVEHTFKRLTQRFENCERFVEDHEEIQTGSTRYLVEDTMTTHAKNTMNVSEELHTMQAEQIHMG